MKKIMKFSVIFLLFAVILFTSCVVSDEKNKQKQETKEVNTDTLYYLYGKWKFEEVGIAMNLEINSDKTFTWNSDFGNFKGTWTLAKNLITFKPSDNLNPPFTLLKDTDGSLKEQTNSDLKPVYYKIK